MSSVNNDTKKSLEELEEEKYEEIEDLFYSKSSKIILSDELFEILNHADITKNILTKLLGSRGSNYYLELLIDILNDVNCPLKFKEAVNSSDNKTLQDILSNPSKLTDYKKYQNSFSVYPIEEIITNLLYSHVKTTYWEVDIKEEVYNSLIEGKRKIDCDTQHSREILGETNFKDFKIVFLLTCCIDVDYDDEEDSLNYDIQHRLNNIVIIGNDELNKIKNDVLKTLDEDMSYGNKEIDIIFDLDNGANDVIYNMGDESFYDF
ncbi:hypothetical protein N9A28_02500 [Sulfurimonas sp.]|nr:hypothetical protein [Sulfurimonas sp.]